MWTGYSGYSYGHETSSNKTLVTDLNELLDIFDKVGRKMAISMKRRTVETASLV